MEKKILREKLNIKQVVLRYIYMNIAVDLDTVEDKDLSALSIYMV